MYLLMASIINMVQAQVQAYQMDHNRLPVGTADLVTDGYLRADETTCPDGRVISISATGVVSAANPVQ